MRQRHIVLFSLLLAWGPLVVNGQESLPPPQEPLLHPDWLEAGQPSVPCDGGGFLYDGYVGHNRFSNWYLRSDVLFLQRSSHVADQVIVQTDVGGAPVISTGDFDFPMIPGLSVLVGHRLDSESAWEASYFGLHNWTTAISAADADNLDLPGSIGVGTDFDNADVMSVSYESRLHNAEFNILRDHDRLAWLAGFRYVSWDEELQIRATNDLASSTQNLQTSNSLFGGQLGARAFFHGQRFDWEITGKAGVFGNLAQQRQLLTDAGDTLVLRNTITNGAACAFVGDLSANVNYRLSRYWSVRGGYNIMEITSLALAPNQLDFTATPGSGRNLNRSGDVFLHGVNFGVEAIW